MARYWDRPQLFEVESKLGYDFELIPGDRRGCQKFYWNQQCFPVDQLGHGRLQVLLKSYSHAEEDNRKGVGLSFLLPANYGGLLRAMQPFHEAVGGWIESCRAG